VVNADTFQGGGNMRDATGRASGSNENRILFFSLFIFTRSYTDKKERERWSLKRVGGEGEMNRQSSLSLMDVTDLTTFPAAILKDNRIVSPSSSSSFSPTQLVLASIFRLDYISLLVHFVYGYKIRSGESIFDWNL
jgi:hypothetical protein